jgi:NH3-dependent NAD+ synthetase
MKMIIKLCLDTQKFSKKPTEEEISKIAARIGCHVKEISIKDFAKSIIIPNGKTYSPSVFKNGQRSIRNWISQQIFVVDIENDSLENVLDTCERVNLFP